MEKLWQIGYPVLEYKGPTPPPFSTWVRRRQYRVVKDETGKQRKTYPRLYPHASDLALQTVCHGVCRPRADFREYEQCLDSWHRKKAAAKAASFAVQSAYAKHANNSAQQSTVLTA